MSESHGRADDGDFMCALWPTANGPVPGKSKDGTIWYYYEREQENGCGQICKVPCFGQDSGIFKVLKEPVVFTDDPKEILKIGEFYSAVANTEWGKIPGVVIDGTCWFVNGSQVTPDCITTNEPKSTPDFKYVGIKKPDPDPIADAAEAEVRIVCSAEFPHRTKLTEMLHNSGQGTLRAWLELGRSQVFR
jgi:hypothetical protein